MSVNDPATTTEVKSPYNSDREVVYEVTDSGNAAAWWVGGLVAIVAILAVVFLVTRNPGNDQQIANAMEQGRLQGALESTQSTLGATQDAARDAAQSAAQQTAAMTSAAAADAQRAARDAAQSASQAASNASAVVPEPAPSSTY